jgi:hypothetical protein
LTWLKEEKLKPTIETYWDPNGNHSGKNGCWFARLKHDRSMNATAETEGGAIHGLLLILQSNGLSGNLNKYKCQPRPGSKSKLR